MNESPKSQVEGAPLIRVRDLTKEYRSEAGAIAVLRGLSLDVYPGEMLGIIGPSGSGKSTLLFILGLFLSPTSGSYLVNGKDVLKGKRSEQAQFRRRCIGFVFQNCNLIENCNVYENIEFPLIYAGFKRKKRPRKIQEALEQVNLIQRIRHPSNLLSGGEQQRVAIARALVSEPQIILADEPTGQLDRDNGRRIMEDFEQFAATKKTATIVVTHDPQVAARCTRVCHLEDGALFAE